ncbi:MAG: ATPase [Parasporobacterium sp.]|nr:ATPase [Parasporobacterium sp.]
MLLRAILCVVVLLTIVLPIGAFFIKGKEKGRKGFKTTLIVNIVSFAVAIIVAQAFVFTETAQAAGAAGEAGIGVGLGYIAAALSVGIACVGSGIAVASSASAALGALSEDPTIFGKSLVFVGLSEGIALYGLIIAFMILGAL